MMRGFRLRLPPGRSPRRARIGPAAGWMVSAAASEMACIGPIDERGDHPATMAVSFTAPAPLMAVRLVAISGWLTWNGPAIDTPRDRPTPAKGQVDGNDVDAPVTGLSLQRAWRRPGRQPSPHIQPVGEPVEVERNSRIGAKNHRGGRASPGRARSRRGLGGPVGMRQPQLAGAVPASNWRKPMTDTRRFLARIAKHSWNGQAS